jgi:hypothetical protein
MAGTLHRGAEELPLFDLPIRGGDISPTEPVALGAWLRRLSYATILAACDGHAWERGDGVEQAHRTPDRVFPALLGVYCFGPREITEGHEHVEWLAENHAPFSVLALGLGGGS